MFKTWRKVDRNSSIWTWREKFPSRAVAAHQMQLCRNRFLRAEVVSVADASFEDMLCGRYHRTLSAANSRMFSICATVCWQKNIVDEYVRRYIFFDLQSQALFRTRPFGHSTSSLFVASFLRGDASQEIPEPSEDVPRSCSRVCNS